MIKHDIIKSKYGDIPCEFIYSYMNASYSWCISINMRTVCEYTFSGCIDSSYDIRDLYTFAIDCITRFVDNSSGMVLNGIFFDTTNMTNEQFMLLCKSKYREENKWKQ